MGVQEFPLIVVADESPRMSKTEDVLLSHFSSIKSRHSS